LTLVTKWGVTITTLLAKTDQAFITALLLVAGLALILFAMPVLAARIAFAVVAALAAWEWAGLMQRPPASRIAFGMLTLALCWLLANAEQARVALLLASSVFWLLVVPFWLRFKWPLGRLGAFAYLLGLLVVLPTWAAMLELHAVSVGLLLAAMALVWVADIAAYFAGRAFGRHKLAPAVSPGKTWEGVAGAIAGVLAYGWVLQLATPILAALPWSLLTSVALLVVLTGVSVIGDLYESLLKRQAGIKDSSNLLPGHGGVLDRIDAQTSTLPLVALLLHTVRQ